MIYSIPKESYPQKGNYIEESTLKDQNGIEWKIARTEKELFILYCGNPYFCDSIFDCDLKDESNIQLVNTGCIVFNSADFDTYCEMRDVIIEQYTDDIWESFMEFFTERFECSTEILETEKVK
jgi:hypothetical protein